jgi:hypothetical protein
MNPSHTAMYFLQPSEIEIRPKRQRFEDSKQMFCLVAHSAVVEAHPGYPRHILDRRVLYPKGTEAHPVVTEAHPRNVEAHFGIILACSGVGCSSWSYRCSERSHGFVATHPRNVKCSLCSHSG